MHARLKARLSSDQGFTLIELLVVIIILGILLAIAVPSYLSFKDRANKAAAEANVRAVVPDVESYNADNTVGNTTNDPDGTQSGDPDYSTHTDSGYQGMTAALLRRDYDQAFPPSVFVFPGDASTTGAPSGTGISAVGTTPTDYCIVSTNGAWYAWKLGPGGQILVGTTLDNVCTSSP
jgi:prepilin-type N-terminal cleavage/methylation domain-containing protein